MVKTLSRRVKTLYFANNGKEGLEKYYKYHPDLVITDMRMPVMNGLEMIQKIRKNKNNIKIIMLSAHSDTKSLLEAIEIGVNGYILKPFQTRKLYKLIEDLADSIILDKKVQEQSEKINELYNSLVKDMETAGSVQEYLLPDNLIIEKELFLTSTYVPSSKIGGDLYDIIKISEDEYISYIGDISGHGVKAALLMTAVKTTINRIIEDENLHEPYLILNRLSNILTRELFSGDYMTLLLFYINCRENKLRLLNAGHPPLIIYNKKEKSITSYHREGSIPIGWIYNYLYTPDEEAEIVFDHDQIMFLYTDGLFECENSNGKELGIEGLKQFIEDNISDSSTVTLPTKIRDTMIDNNYDISSDDFTLLAFSRIPDSSMPNSKELFCGNCKTDFHLFIDNAVSIVNQRSKDKQFAKDIKKYAENWLVEFIDIDEYYFDFEAKYLAEIVMNSNDNLKINLWSKSFNLITSKLDDNNGVSAVLAKNLKVSLYLIHHDGFQEIVINLKKQ